MLLTFLVRILGRSRHADHAREDVTRIPTHPDADASQIWREQLATAFGQLRAEDIDATGRDDRCLLGALSSTTLGRACAFHVSGTPQVVRRTETSVSRAPADPLKICIQRAGRAVVHQGSHELALAPGELAIYDTGRPYDLRLDGGWSCSVLTVPRDALGVPPRSVAEAMTHRWPAGTGPGALLGQMIDSSVTDGGNAGAVHLGEASVHLLAGMVAQDPDAAGERAEEDVRAQIVGYVRSHLREPSLSHGSVAAAHRMSSRTLSRLFACESESVAGLIRRFRLEAIRRDLLDPGNRNRATTAIAAAWGYRDPAHFTRSFRRRFGVTPGALRSVAD